MTEIMLRVCPVCGKEPRVKRDQSYEAAGFGARCTIQCKPFLRKPHLRVESGKSQFQRAFEEAAEAWNRRADDQAEMMTFEYFDAWCNDRAADGCWGFLEALTCCDIMREMHGTPRRKRKKKWAELNANNCIYEEIVKPTNEKIAEVEAAVTPGEEEQGCE